MKTLNLNNWDFSNFTNISFIGTALNNEFNIIGKFSGIKANLQLQNLRNLTVDSVITVFEALEDISEQSITRSISLYSTVKALLTEEQIAIATSKGWTVS